MSDLSMMISDITTENASGEVATFDFRSNMVYGEKIDLEDAKRIIDNARKLNELAGLSAIQSGYYLLALKERGADAIKELGYANIYDLAKETLGISRGVTSERLQVAIRYRDTENVSHYGIDSAYAGFKYSALLQLRKLSNEEIAEKGITAETKFLEIAEKLAPKAESSETEQTEETKAESSETEQTEEPKEAPIDTEAKEVETFEIDFSELPDYVKVNLRKFYRGQKKELTGTLVITNLK